MTEELPSPLFRLPNEILLAILDRFLTRDLVAIASICRRIHSLTLRLFHTRLQSATNLEGYTLFLECGPPEARFTTTKILCASTGTPGLSVSDPGGSPFGRFHRLAQLYTRFRPVTEDVETRPPPRHPAGDIPGSRTFLPLGPSFPSPTPVSLLVAVDAHNLFSQLETVAFLGQRDPSRGLLTLLQPVCDATIRVWRTWLAQQCESKRWTDGEPIAVHAGVSDVNSDSSSAIPDTLNPHLDSGILWINTPDKEVGIKFRVHAQNWRRDMPVLVASDMDAPVSYHVTLDEVLIRTTHLLLQLEQAHRQMRNSSAASAVIFRPLLRGSGG